jgi:type II secretory pathway component GspD/PulD (secretin)
MNASLAVPVTLVVIMSLASPVMADETNPPREYQVTPIPLKSACARKVAKKLEARFHNEPGFHITHDEPTNTVFIGGSLETLQQARALIKRLDVSRPRYIRVVRLKNLNATRNVQRLEAIQRVAQYFERELLDFHVTADQRANQIIISGSEDEMQAISLFFECFDSLARE